MFIVSLILSRSILNSIQEYKNNVIIYNINQINI